MMRVVKRINETILYDSFAEDVVEVEHAEVEPVAIDYDELGDAVGAHEVQGVDGVFAVGYAFGVSGHDVGSGEGVERGIGFYHAAQVAVGDDALYGKTAFSRCGHYGAAQSARRHLEDGFAHGGVGRDEGALVLQVEVAHAHIELFAQCTTGMETGEVTCGETAAGHESYGEGIAHDQLRGGAAGGCQVVGAGFMGNGDIQHDICLAGKEGVGVADDGDEFVAEVLDQWDKHLYFGGVATLGDADDHIAGLYHAEVAVDSVGGVHEEGRRARAVEGGDNLCCDVCAFADAGYYHTAGGAKNSFHGLRKAVVDMSGETFNSFFFFCNYFNCNVL